MARNSLNKLYQNPNYREMMQTDGDFVPLASRETYPSQADEDLFAMPQYAIRDETDPMALSNLNSLSPELRVDNGQYSVGPSTSLPISKGQNSFTNADISRPTSNPIGNNGYGAEQANKDKNALNTMFQGAVMGGDLEKAARLAVTPAQMAMLDAAQGQFVNERDARGRQAQYDDRLREIRESGANPIAMRAQAEMLGARPVDAKTNLVKDYRDLQELNLRSGEHLEDRALNTKKTNAQINELDAKTAMERLKANAPVGNKAQEAFSVKTAEQTAKAIADARDKLQSSYAGISRIDEMKKVLDSGVYSGTLAEGRTGVANFFETLGVTGIDKEKLRNSQEYMKHVKTLTLEALKESMGTTQLSNADRDFVAATVPQLDTDPEARIRLLKYMRNKYQNNISNFDAMEKHATQNGGSLTGFKPMELSSMNLGGGNSPVTKLTW